ncbi:MAG TPA: type IV pilus assembly protein PilM [Candidatus Saccharimonadales bacterium]|nr:type IV pilus assembly protein PilM [Candidatus Saccharimonadales bacterium]
MKSNIFGLDIGQSTIKAVWLSTEKEGYLLDAVLSIPTPANTMLSESALDQQELAGVIKKIVEDAKIEAKSVNIALPENQVYTKIIEVPYMSDKDLSSAIYWEAEQQIPVALTNLTLDYKVLEHSEKGDASQKMRVLLVGTATRLIEKYQKILSLAGLEIAAVETEVLSVMRAIVPPEVIYPTSLIVCMGTFNTSLTIVRKNTIVFTYSVPLGGAAITRAIAAKFGFSTTQAEEYKKIYGLSESNFEGKIAQAAEPILVSILGEVKKTFAYHRNMYKDDPIMQITLTGGPAKLPGLPTFFAKHAGIETTVANPWKILFEQDVPKEIIDNAPEYTVAVGLAMRNND